MELRDWIQVAIDLSYAKELLKKQYIALHINLTRETEEEHESPQV
jgi:hypothetical protein